MRTYSVFGKEATPGSFADKNPSPTDATLGHSVASETELGTGDQESLNRLGLFSSLRHLKPRTCWFTIAVMLGTLEEQRLCG